VVEQAEMSVTLTPNPFTNTIEVSGNDHMTSVEIVDVTGKTRLATLVNGTRATINTEDLSNGVYLMRINNGTTTITKRILKH
jgi:Secretion system C-terminal sorting domain